MKNNWKYNKKVGSHTPSLPPVSNILASLMAFQLPGSAVRRSWPSDRTLGRANPDRPAGCDGAADTTVHRTGVSAWWPARWTWPAWPLPGTQPTKPSCLAHAAAGLFGRRLFRCHFRASAARRTPRGDAAAGDGGSPAGKHHGWADTGTGDGGAARCTLPAVRRRAMCEKNEAKDGMD